MWQSSVGAAAGAGATEPTATHATDATLGDRNTHRTTTASRQHRDRNSDNNNHCKQQSRPLRRQAPSKAKDLTQRELAERVGINFTYLSKIENHRLGRYQFPREDTIKALAAELDASAEDLLLLAKKIPESIKARIIKRPDAFRKMASLDDETMDRLLRDLDE